MTHCSSCQAENRDEAKFCVRCGHHMEHTAAPVAPVEVAAPAAQASVGGLAIDSPAVPPMTVSGTHAAAAPLTPHAYPLMRGMPAEKPAAKLVPQPVVQLAPEPAPGTEMVREATAVVAHSAPEVIEVHTPPAVATVPSGAAAKSPVAAALLSALLPGGGQCYNRDYKRAALIWVLYIVSFLLLNAVPALGMVLNLGAWVWAMINAYSVAAGKTNRW